MRTLKHEALASDAMTTQQSHAALRAPRTVGLASPAFTHGRGIPREHTGFGSDVSPPLRLSGIPNATRALALVVDDPDAPGGTFTHWTAWNLPPRRLQIEAAQRLQAAGGVEGTNDFGVVGYRGPKPPSGTHRYFFRAFALDHALPLERGAAPAEVWRELDAHTLAWGELIGTFTRP